MDIQQVNLVLEKAIGFFQESELESLHEVGFTIPTPQQMHQKTGMHIPDEMKKPKFKVPSPGQMHKKHGMPVPSGTVKGGLIGKGEAREGMKLGDSWEVVRATPTRVTIQIFSRAFTSGRSKAFTYKWDGYGYERGGKYLTYDGTDETPGSKPVDPQKLYPEGTVIQGREKWIFVIAGKGKKTKGVWSKDWYYTYPVKKRRGKKVFDMIIYSGNFGIEARVRDGRKDMTLTNVKVHPPK